jgi:S-DNA-T family DNA segregation ATPase FtsK/SpoIIIE
MAKSKSSKSAATAAVPKKPMSDGAREMLALVLSGFSLYALLCLVTFHTADLDQPIPIGGGRNLGGAFGYHLAAAFTYVVGFASVLPFVALLGCAVALFLHKRIERPTLKAIGAWMFTAMVALLLADPRGGASEQGFTAMTPHGPGGAFGANLSPRLYEIFGGPGRILLLAFGALVSLVVATEWMFSQALQKVAFAVRSLFFQLRSRRAALAGGGEVDVEESEDDESEPKPRKARQPKATRAKAVVDLEDEDDEEVENDDEEDEVPAAKKPARAKPKQAAAKVDEDDDLLDDDEDEEPEAPKAAKADKKQKGKDAAKAEPAPAEPVRPAAVVPQRAPVVITPSKPKPKPKPKQVELPFDETYPFPSIELFKEVKTEDGTVSSEVLTRGGEAIIRKLSSFGIEATIVGAAVGPAVTQYELQLAEGIRVNKITGYADDLAAALQALSVRIVAPIPGKGTIGIEVPNSKRQKVPMRDLLEQFGRSEDLAIPLYLGKDVSGAPIVEDLARMPHLLIAGTTGSGKSVCINAILLSILMTRTPAQVKLILIDPKQVELQAYKNVPHLCCEVVCNMRKAPSVLQWAVDEMENRYTMMNAAGVNHIKLYNGLGQQELEKRMKRAIEPDRVRLPYVVIVVDEWADLMNVAQNEVEESIQRLAQKSRAVGMHVILATQRPSSEVITGVIKANLPCQIAFKVNRKIDSRVILDNNGAEKLLGHGDMLYVPPGSGGLTRAQGAFVSEEELHAVVSFLEAQGQRPTYLPALVQEAKARRKSPADRDELYPTAVEVVLGNQRGSATLLQRALGVGYTRGTRLLEMMEEDGLVGAFNDSKPREVLMTLEEYQAREAAMEEEMARIEEDEASAGSEDSSDALAGSVAGDDDGDGDGADADESSKS